MKQVLPRDCDVIDDIKMADTVTPTKHTHAQLPPGDVTGVNTKAVLIPSTSSQSVDNETKLGHAREHLASTLKDKTLMSSTKWNQRSATELELANHHNKHNGHGQNGELAPLTRLQRRPSGLNWRKDPLTNPTSVPYSYHIGFNNNNAYKGEYFRPRTRGQIKSAQLNKNMLDAQDSGTWTRNVTISELHKIMNDNTTMTEQSSSKYSRVSSSRYDQHQLPHSEALKKSGFKINITGTQSGTHPGIALTFSKPAEDNNATNQETNIHKTSHNDPMAAKHGRHSYQQKATIRRKSDALKTKAVQSPTDVLQCLLMMDKDRPSSSERIQKWLHDNPLTEVEEKDLQEMRRTPTPLPPVEGTNQMRGKPGRPGDNKKVRFVAVDRKEEDASTLVDEQQQQQERNQVTG